MLHGLQADPSVRVQSNPERFCTNLQYVIAWLHAAIERQPQIVSLVPKVYTVMGCPTFDDPNGDIIAGLAEGRTSPKCGLAAADTVTLAVGQPFTIAL